MKLEIIKLPVFFLCMSFLLPACGPTPAPRVLTEVQDELVEEETNRWTYLAVLKPLNAPHSGHINGSVTLDLDDDRFLADVRVALAPEGILHFQSVHTGNRCPEAADDLNGDGFIDAIEGNSVYGNRLIPLDGNLNGQLAGLNIAPVADQWGNYIYVRMASYERLLSDLKKPDEQPDDDMDKLPADETLRLSGRVVVLYGISNRAQLPETVQKLWHWGPHQSLPIACGILKRVRQAPGVPYEDDFLGDAPVTDDEVPEILVPGAAGV
jgi:hypothetical protein